MSNSKQNLAKTDILTIEQITENKINDKEHPRNLIPELLRLFFRLGLLFDYYLLYIFCLLFDFTRLGNWYRGRHFYQVKR